MWHDHASSPLYRASRHLATLSTPHSEAPPSDTFSPRLLPASPHLVSSPWLTWPSLLWIPASPAYPCRHLATFPHRPPLHTVCHRSWTSAQHLGTVRFTVPAPWSVQVPLPGTLFSSSPPTPSPSFRGHSLAYCCDSAIPLLGIHPSDKTHTCTGGEAGVILRKLAQVPRGVLGAHTWLVWNW